MKVASCRNDRAIGNTKERLPRLLWLLAITPTLSLRGARILSDEAISGIQEPKNEIATHHFVVLAMTNHRKGRIASALLGPCNDKTIRNTKERLPRLPTADSQ